MVAISHVLPEILADGSAQTNTWLETLRAYYRPDEMQQLEAAIAVVTPLYATRCDEFGLPMLAHALSATAILAAMRLDMETLIATLLYATVDIAPHLKVPLQHQFGATVTKLMEGVWKMNALHTLRLDTQQPEQAEAMRKMLLAMVDDIRVVIIKLAKRTHALRWAQDADNETRLQIAREVRDVYAPLANRMGLWQIKWEMEDLSFRYLEPDVYKRIAKLLDERRIDREAYINQVIDALKTELKQTDVMAEITGRPKHIFSIYNKMQKKKLAFEQLYDVRAVRVLVHSIKECYAVLGIVHNLWRPIPGEFDDYIAHPKNNFYRSLHTAVVGPEDKAVEVQIRTIDMHHHAELGVAAHWRYKEGSAADQAFDQKIAWLRKVLEKRDLGDTGEVVAEVSNELFNDTVYVLTPQGKVVDLPQGATPIDFAYHVHTQLGHRCRGAKVEGLIVPLNYTLRNGQRVEIITAKEGGPSRDWLAQSGFVRSSRARAKIRNWFNSLNLETTLSQGRQVLEKELNRADLAFNASEQVAEKLRFQRLEDLYVALGRGDIGLQQLSNLLRELKKAHHTPAADSPTMPSVRASRANPHKADILVNGVDKLLTTMAKCCKPVPPDPITGFITKGRGVTIHREDCSVLAKLRLYSPERMVTAVWGQACDTLFPVDVAIHGRDLQPLLRQISDVLAKERVNITTMKTHSHGLSVHVLCTLEIQRAAQLERLLRLLRELPCVISANRA